MREIKFRAWVDGRGMDYCEAHRSLGVFMEHHENNYQIGGFKLMQYTGIIDKNGKEIYEGDIVKDENGCIYEVKYLTPFAAFGLEDIKDRSYIDFVGQIFTERDDYYRWEVIGNIYEHSYLLK